MDKAVQVSDTPEAGMGKAVQASDTPEAGTDMAQAGTDTPEADTDVPVGADLDPVRALVCFLPASLGSNRMPHILLLHKGSL